MTAARSSSWVPIPAHSDFPLQNLPYGSFSTPDRPRRIGVAIGDRILDVRAAADAGLFDTLNDPEPLRVPVLNALLARGRPFWTALRERLTELLGGETELRDRADWDTFFVEQGSAAMHLPFEVGDYVDFYSSLEHATNLGKILRPDSEPLLPNWRWIPIGYHGRSSTIVIDGRPIVRPSGQRKAPDAAAPIFAPSASLDVELELGFVTGPGNRLGSAIAIDDARDHIFGLVIVNDWSARDIQAWEYQPLGPFLGKSFATSISPWVVTLDALEPFRVGGPQQEPPPLAHLRTTEAWNYDIRLQIELQTDSMRKANEPPAVVSQSNARDLYWSFAQQLAHAASNGTAIRPGDLYASGTISGEDPHSYGSFMELTWRGARPLQLPSGETRAFLEDGDAVTLRAWCEAAGKPRIGFGSVSGTIVPA